LLTNKCRSREAGAVAKGQDRDGRDRDGVGKRGQEKEKEPGHSYIYEGKHR